MFADLSLSPSVLSKAREKLVLALDRGLGDAIVPVETSKDRVTDHLMDQTPLKRC